MSDEVRMSLTLPEELWKKISHLAVEQHKSKNELILTFIEEALKQLPKKE